MEVIAQAAIGVSGFLHPDYVSAGPSVSLKIDFSDGIFSQGEIFLTTGLVILAILVVHFIGVLRKRFSRMD